MDSTIKKTILVSRKILEAAKLTTGASVIKYN